LSRQVKKIPATISRFTAAPINSKTKRRVAGYARVSTDHEDQTTSYAAQVDYYTNYIKGHEDWEFAGIYTDEGISATNTKKREGFRHMISDALDGKIDLIVTKSVSRFARNTVDSLTTIRELKEKGVECYFEKENIWTLDSKGELLITIMSSLAQEESRSISENVTWGQRKRMADGKVSFAYSRFLGLDKDKETGKIVVNQEQAKTVRLIFRLFLEGLTPNAIAKELTNRGIKTPSGKDVWNQSTVRRMLSNLSLSILIQCNDSGYVKKSEKYSAFSVFDRWRRSVDVLLNSRSFYARRAKKAKCTHNHTIAFYRVIVGLSCNDMQLKKPDTVS
jgi:site-specific DNA recombinase